MYSVKSWLVYVKCVLICQIYSKGIKDWNLESCRQIIVLGGKHYVYKQCNFSIKVFTRVLGSCFRSWTVMIRISLNKARLRIYFLGKLGSLCWKQKNYVWVDFTEFTEFGMQMMKNSQNGMVSRVIVFFAADTSPARVTDRIYIYTFSITSGRYLSSMTTLNRFLPRDDNRFFYFFILSVARHNVSW